MLPGLGRDDLRKEPVNEAFQIKVDEPCTPVAADRARGVLPMVMANADTVHVSAIDGLALNFHKWLYVPYKAGSVLVRNGDQHRQTFPAVASYPEAPICGIRVMADTTNGRGSQLSRGLKAQKVWLQTRPFGLKRLGRFHDQNVGHIQNLAGLMADSKQLELLAPCTPEHPVLPLPAQYTPHHRLGPVKPGSVDATVARLHRRADGHLHPWHFSPACGQHQPPQSPSRHRPEGTGKPAPGAGNVLGRLSVDRGGTGNAVIRRPTLIAAYQ